MMMMMVIEEAPDPGMGVKGNAVVVHGVLTGAPASSLAY